MALVDSGRVTARDAYMKAINKQRFEGLISEA